MELDPASLGKVLMRDYDKAQKAFRQAMARQFVLGRQLAEIREDLGEPVFREWLRTCCPRIPETDAEVLIKHSGTSALARRVDAVLGKPER